MERGLEFASNRFEYFIFRGIALWQRKNHLNHRLQQLALSSRFGMRPVNFGDIFPRGQLEDVKGFCAVATTEQIASQDYILTPGRYVGIEEKEEDAEPFDEKMTRLTTELGELFAKSHELEDEIRKNLGVIGWKIERFVSSAGSLTEMD